MSVPLSVRPIRFQPAGAVTAIAPRSDSATAAIMTSPFWMPAGTLRTSCASGFALEEGTAGALNWICPTVENGVATGGPNGAGWSVATPTMTVETLSLTVSALMVPDPVFATMMR